MTGTAIIDQINQLRRIRRGPTFEMPLRCFPRSLWMDMVRRQWEERPVCTCVHGHAVSNCPYCKDNRL